jgi:hypothetical protein
VSAQTFGGAMAPHATAVTLDDVAAKAEQVGYMRAFVDILSHLQEIKCRDGSRAVAIFGIAKGLSRGVPYPEFCRHPDKCAGKSYCPRDPTCAD